MLQFDGSSVARRLALAFGCFFSVIIACEPAADVVVAPYEGEAYPERAAPVAYPAGPVAFVTNSLSDTLSVIDLEAAIEIANVPVGRNPVDLDGPHHVALDLELGNVFVGLSYPVIGSPGPHGSHSGSTAFGYAAELSLYDLTPKGEVRVDRNPGDIILGGAHVVVSHFDLLRVAENPTDREKARAPIALIGRDPFVGSAARLVETCVAPHGMVFARGKIWVACYGEDAVASVDPETGEADVFPIDPSDTSFGSPTYGPYALLASSGEQFLWVSNIESKTLDRFDLETHTWSSAHTFLGAPFFNALLPNGDLAVTTQSPDGLLVFPPDETEPSVEVVFDRATCEFPHVVAPFDDALALVCEGDQVSPGALVILELDGSVRSRVPLGVFPDAIVIADGSILRDVARAL